MFYAEWLSRGLERAQAHLIRAVPQLGRGYLEQTAYAYVVTAMGAPLRL